MPKNPNEFGRVDIRTRTKQLGKLKTLVAREFQKCIRVESAGPDGKAECVTCKKRVWWQDGDGGHFISRTKTPTIFEEDNVHFQCKSCNRFDATNAKAKYYAFMVDLFGVDRVNELIDLSNEKWVYTRDEFLAFRHEFVTRWRAGMKLKGLTDSKVS